MYVLCLGSAELTGPPGLLFPTVIVTGSLWDEGGYCFYSTPGLAVCYLVRGVWLMGVCVYVCMRVCVYEIGD